jgi:hypothetical protein
MRLRSSDCAFAARGCACFSGAGFATAFALTGFAFLTGAFAAFFRAALAFFGAAFAAPFFFGVFAPAVLRVRIQLLQSNAAWRAKPDVS